MADLNLPGFLAPLTNITSTANWINLAINIIVSTIVGGIVLMIVVGIISRSGGETVRLINAFFFVLVLNLINYLGVLGLISGYITVVPFLTLILPLLIWIILSKLFFSDLSFLHAVIVGVIGYGLSIFLIPYLTSFIMPYIPSF